MSQKRRAKGWWLICLMAGWGASPLAMAEPTGVVSRAVEVAPPKGWTPDTPLFHDESAAPVREEAPRATQIPATRRVMAVTAEPATSRSVLAPKAAQKTKARHATVASAKLARAERPQLKGAAARGGRHASTRVSAKRLEARSQAKPPVRQASASARSARGSKRVLTAKQQPARPTAAKPATRAKRVQVKGAAQVMAQAQRAPKTAHPGGRGNRAHTSPVKKG